MEETFQKLGDNEDFHSDLILELQQFEDILQNENLLVSILKGVNLHEDTGTGYL
ncbi:hypothetical protein [Methanobacterium subterraneum]|uniref:hypothetical protein n=1 Tax=Methanobacterium subterraneum TaxID=59277 RepID=UPI0012FDF00E|nr:hypothetical protein [Methanobacterium subterraneum]